MRHLTALARLSERMCTIIIVQLLHSYTDHNTSLPLRHYLQLRSVCGFNVPRAVTMQYVCRVPRLLTRVNDRIVKKRVNAPLIVLRRLYAP